MNTPLVDIRSLTVLFGAEKALDNITLSIAEGSIVALLGQSGCGKSTLLRVITGLVSPSAGKVFVHGQELFAAKQSRAYTSRKQHEERLAEIRRTIGYMIQDGGLFPHLTARENIMLVWKYLRQSSQEVEVRIKDLCALTRLQEDALARFPAQLSGGQRQRVALMRALMLKPQLLLFDEPFAALDPIIRYDLQEDVRRIVRELDTTMILVTHDVSEAAFFADTVVIMNEGQILQIGTMQEIRTQPANAFVERFLSVQRMFSNENSKED